MRKRDPDALVDQFQIELNRSLADWSALSASGLSVGLARRATMDAFTRLAVAFERFRSDWYVAAITRDSTAFAAHQQRRLEGAVNTALQKSLLPYCRVVLPTHLTIRQVEALLDAQGGNVSIRTMKHWKEMAKKNLADPWLSRVNDLTFEVTAPADAVIAIRNAASHQSVRALKDMSAALANLTHPTHAGLQRATNKVTTTGIPAYLHGGSGASQRIVRYYSAATALSNQLRK